IDPLKSPGDSADARGPGLRDGEAPAGADGLDLGVREADLGPPRDLTQAELPLFPLPEPPSQPAPFRDPPPRPPAPAPVSKAKGDAVAPTGERRGGPEAPAAESEKAVQMHDLYLLVEEPDGILVIDQHALHERVLFERFQEQLTAGRLEAQGLLVT